MPRSLLLVHSPLVGPSTLRPLAELITADRTAPAVVPDLTRIAQVPTPRWRWAVDTVVSATATLPGLVDLVAHSGAGVWLPSIAAGLGRRRGTLAFVDAIVPPASGVQQHPAGRLAALDALTSADGRLAPWFDWWDEETVRALVPDVELRTALAAECPRVPRALYDEQIPVPDGWAAWPAVYLQLGSPYDEDAEVARAHGWPVERVDLDHLAVATRPDQVWAALSPLLDQASPDTDGGAGASPR